MATVPQVDPNSPGAWETPTFLSVHFSPVNHHKEGLEVLQSETSLEVCQWGQSRVSGGRWGDLFYSSFEAAIEHMSPDSKQHPNSKQSGPDSPRYHLLLCAWILTGGHVPKSLCGHFNLLAFVKIKKCLADRQDLCPQENSDLEQ